MEPSNRLLSKSISQGELLMAVIIIVAAGLGFWKSTDVRLTLLENRMNQTEKVSETIINKLDRVQDGVNDVRLIIKDKQDKKFY